MNIEKLNKAKKYLLEVEDIEKLLSVSKESAHVTVSRYVKNKRLLRLKRGLYISPDKFNSLNEEALFQIANLLQTPSYISLTTALSYYDISTQQQQNYIESVALKRTKTYKINNVEFTFNLVKKDFYCGFELVNSFFIASPEKAFADSLYLTALAKYSCDFEAIDFKKLNLEVIDNFLKKTNPLTLKFWDKLCKTYKL